MAFSFKARFRGRRAVAMPPLCPRSGFALPPFPGNGPTSEVYRTYTCFGTELWRKKSDNRPCPRPSVPVPNNFPSPCVI